MKVRKSQWYDIKNHCVLYSFQVHVDGKWCHAHKDGVPCIYKLDSQRDIAMQDAKRRMQEDRKA